MRTDALESTVGPVDPPDPGRTPPPRASVARALPVFVGGLVLGTSAAVAMVAWWLVPPYLALMAFLLLEPAGRRVSATNPAGPESAPSGASAPAGMPDPAAAAGPDGPSPPTDATPAPKARRGGKGRGTRKARPAVEPAPAAWVQVAPGKFVRVEAGTPSAETGPHSSPPPGTIMPEPLAAPAAVVPGLDEPDRPSPAGPGPHDAPQEAALDLAHHDPASAEGPAPDGPRDPDPADPRVLRDDVARAESAAPDRDVTPDPGPRPDPGAPRVEAAGADPIRDAHAPSTDEHDPDPAAGTQPEAMAEALVIVRAEGAAVAVEPPARGEPGVESASTGDGPDADPTADDDAGAEGLAPQADAPLFVAATVGAGPMPPCDVTNEPADESPDDSSPQPLVDAAGTSFRGGGAAIPFGPGVPPSRRNVRPGRVPHQPHGLRLRSKRGDGRPLHFARTFPPRSPPRRGLIRA